MAIYQVEFRRRAKPMVKPISVRLEAMDSSEARQIAELTYGHIDIVAVQRTRDQPSATSSGLSGASNVGHAGTGSVIGFGILVVIFGPLLLIAGIPALLVFIHMNEQQVHGGLILITVLGTLGATAAVLWAFFAYIPGWLLALLGFALYGGIGYQLGSDPIWGAIIGAVGGFVGASINYGIGIAAKSGRSARHPPLVHY